MARRFRCKQNLSLALLLPLFTLCWTTARALSLYRGEKDEEGGGGGRGRSYHIPRERLTLSNVSAFATGQFISIPYHQ